MNALSQSNDLFACNLIYCLRTCQTPWHSARGRALLPCENLSVKVELAGWLAGCLKYEMLSDEKVLQ